jgi:hypothetical protein
MERPLKKGAGYFLPGACGSGVIIRLDRMIQMGYPPLLICQDWGMRGLIRTISAVSYNSITNGLICGDW